MARLNKVGFDAKRVKERLLLRKPQIEPVDFRSLFVGYILGQGVLIVCSLIL